MSGEDKNKNKNIYNSRDLRIKHKKLFSPNYDISL